MSTKGVLISKGKVGANISGQPFRTSALLTTGIAVAGLVLGQVYALSNINDADALGLNPAYDTTNNVVVYEHVSEFFRTSGGGAKLFLMVAPQATPLADLFESVAFAKKLITEAKGEIYNLAVGFNPAVGYVPTLVDGLNADVRAAILKAQTLYTWADENFMPLQIVLEGRGYAGPAATALDLRAIPGTPSGILEADKVSLVIGQDYDFAATLTGHAQKYAAIGTALGNVAAVELNANIAEVDTQNITNEQRGKFTQAGLSSHQKVEAVQADWETLDAKGYIFPMLYTGISGYRWNDNATCTPVIVDSEGNMNEHTQGYGRTLDYCKRELRKALLPWVKSVKPVNAVTGKLAIGIVKEMESTGDEVFERMQSMGWLSAGKTFVDKDSDVLVSKIVNISFVAVPYGTIGEIRGTINLKIRS